MPKEKVVKVGGYSRAANYVPEYERGKPTHRDKKKFGFTGPR